LLQHVSEETHSQTYTSISYGTDGAIAL